MFLVLLAADSCLAPTTRDLGLASVVHPSQGPPFVDGRTTPVAVPAPARLGLVTYHPVYDS